jgi:hypothetical protein
VAKPRLLAWDGPAPNETYNGKPVLDSGGKPAFAELLILEAFIAAGWEGAWVDTYRNRFLTSFWPVPQRVAVPSEKKGLLAEIRRAGGSKARPWDVFCWRGETVMFVEAKRQQRDKIRPSQTDFLAGALTLGLSTRSFLLMEWGLASANE